MLQKFLLPPYTRKISFLIANEIQNTETAVGQHACWILAFFSENKRIMTESLAPSLTAEQQRRAWREQSPTSYSSRCQMKRKTENKLKLSFIKGGLINLCSIACQLHFQLYSALPRCLQNSGPVSDPILGLTATTVLACWCFQIQSKPLIFFVLCDLKKKMLLFLFNCKQLKLIGVH